MAEDIALTMALFPMLVFPDSAVNPRISKETSSID
jgi:hypothetical protein